MVALQKFVLVSDEPKSQYMLRMRATWNIKQETFILTLLLSLIFCQFLNQSWIEFLQRRNDEWICGPLAWTNSLTTLLFRFFVCLFFSILSHNIFSHFSNITLFLFELMSKCLHITNQRLLWQIKTKQNFF